MPTIVNDKLISWASDIDQGTIRQAEKTARLPIVEGHVALMADAHVGLGATVGSVIPTKSAIIPAAVGVDIGCGMIAAEPDVSEDQLPDSLEPLLGRIEKVVPATPMSAPATVESRLLAPSGWLRKTKPRSRSQASSFCWSTRTSTNESQVAPRVISAGTNQ